MLEAVRNVRALYPFVVSLDQEAFVVSVLMFHPHNESIHAAVVNRKTKKAIYSELSEQPQLA